MRWKLAALSAFAILLLSMLLWRQTNQLASARAGSAANMATIVALDRARAATEQAMVVTDKGKTAAVHKLMQDRQQVAQAVRNDEVVATWHDTPLPGAVLGVLAPGPDHDRTTAAPGHAHAGD